MAIYLKSPLTMADCTRRVASITDLWRMNGSDPVVGKVRDDRFCWQLQPGHRHPFHLIGPRLYVRLSQEDDGTMLSGKFRPTILGLLWLLLFVPLWALIMVSAWPTALTWAALLSGSGIVLLIFGLVGIFFFLLGRWGWVERRQMLTELLRKTLDAKITTQPSS